MVRGDLGDFAQVEEAFREHEVTHVVHLGALQVPFCKADPVNGARVNVSGALDATVRGSGSIEYLGSPQVTSTVTGSGNIKPK